MKDVALVTGSSRGIGAAIAALLARRGYAVCINYLEQREKAEALVAELHWAISVCWSTTPASPGISSFRMWRRRHCSGSSR